MAFPLTYAHRSHRSNKAEVQNELWECMHIQSSRIKMGKIALCQQRIYNLPALSDAPDTCLYRASKAMVLKSAVALSLTTLWHAVRILERKEHSKLLVGGQE